MNRNTGADMERLAHIRQSIGDILTTPIGSRLMRREYGSLVPDLIDQPLNGTTIVRLYAATVAALLRWEPRIRVSRVQLDIRDTPGAATLILSATRIDTNEALSLSVPVRLGAIA